LKREETLDEDTPPGIDLSRFKRPLGTAGAILVYFAATYILVGRGLLGDLTGRIVSIDAGYDPSQPIWYMAWFPFAITHHLDPFLTRYVWAPDGMNVAWATSMPAASLLAWPMTSALGPVAAFNTWCFLSLPLAAFAAFLLCRHLTGRSGASILGGYVFGFSPYFLSHLQSHLILILAFPVPLAILLMVRLLEGTVRSRVFVPVMAVLLALQFGLSLELFASLTAVGIVVLMMGFALGPEHWRAAVQSVTLPLAASYALAGLLSAPLWYYLFAFGFPKGAVNSPSAVSIDFLNFLIPTDTNLLGANATLEHITSRFGFRPEAGGWIPWPLLVVAALYLRARWRKPLGKVLIVTLVLLAIASLGPRLRIDGHALFGLPWKIVEHIPMAKNVLPGRLLMYGFLILGVMTAVMLSSAELPRLAKYALAIAIPIFMLPNLDYRFWTLPLNGPAFFAEGTFYSFLQKDETVVILPYSNRGNSMIWQAMADFYFRMAGGNTGPVVIDDFQKWPAIHAIYNGTDLADSARQMGAFLAAHDVRHVIVEERHAAEYLPVLAMLHDVSLAATHVGDVIVFPIATDKIAQYRGLKPIDLEARYDRDRFNRLVVAADKYLTSGGDPAALTPSHAAKSNLLPPSWGIDDDVDSRDGLILGPWKDGLVQVGVVGSFDAVKALIADYRGDAAEVYFPFPHILAGPPSGHTFMRKLVLVFDRASLARAAQRASSELAAEVAPVAGLSRGR
jgi:hypothetical protein